MTKSCWLILTMPVVLSAGLLFAGQSYLATQTSPPQGTVMGAHPDGGPSLGSVASTPSGEQEAMLGKCSSVMPAGWSSIWASTRWSAGATSARIAARPCTLAAVGALKD